MAAARGGRARICSYLTFAFKVYGGHRRRLNIMASRHSDAIGGNAAAVAARSVLELPATWV
jgi:hypothetical protein